MDKKTSCLLLAISSCALALGGLILLVLQIASETKNNTLLCFAFLAIILSNLFNLIRAQMSKKNDDNSQEN